jgi:gluconate 2-dehydrogenase alpha chain
MSTITHPHTDVCLVGMGWVSGIVAAELTRAGLHVVGLERGQNRGTQDWQRDHDELRYGLNYEMMQDTSLETWSLRHDLRETALPIRTLGSFLPGEGLGGAGVHWNGMTWRFHPRDFQIRSHTIQRYGASSIPSDVTIQDWGVTYDQLEPYYDRFEKMAGISGKAGHLNGKIVAGGNPFEGNRKSEYPTPPQKHGLVHQMFADGARKVGMHPFPVPSANLSQQYTNPDGITRAGCTYCGFCEKFGCEVGAKADATVTVIPIAMRTGKLEMRFGANVVGFDHSGAHVSAVRYIDAAGNEHVQPANMFLLASFIFNNVRLLLQSKLGRPYNPGSGDGVVGKNYAYQVSAGGQGFFYDKDFKPYMNSGSNGWALDDWNADNFDHHGLGFIGGGIVQCTPTGGRPIEQGTTVPKGTPRWGPQWKAALKKSYGHVMNVGMQGEVIANRNHFLDLDPTYRDRYGNPLLRITFDWTPNERKMVGFMSQKFAKILQAAGAKDISVTKDLEPHYDTVRYQSTHNTGGTIMGSDPHTSVVNSYLQMWDVQNLFVVGSSNFPQNAGFNPTGTVGALAYRAAEGMKKYHARPGALA